jgi:hypothetical protein
VESTGRRDERVEVRGWERGELYLRCDLHDRGDVRAMNRRRADLEA